LETLVGGRTSSSDHNGRDKDEGGVRVNVGETETVGVLFMIKVIIKEAGVALSVGSTTDLRVTSDAIGLLSGIISPNARRVGIHTFLKRRGILNTSHGIKTNPPSFAFLLS